MLLHLWTEMQAWSRTAISHTRTRKRLQCVGMMHSTEMHSPPSISMLGIKPPRRRKVFADETKALHIYLYLLCTCLHLCRLDAHFCCVTMGRTSLIERWTMLSSKRKKEKESYGRELPETLPCTMRRGRWLEHFELTHSLTRIWILDSFQHVC